MRIVSCSCALALLVLMLSGSPALGIVAPPNTPAEFTGEWTGYNWTFASAPVYMYENLSCEAISADTIITAAHCSPKVGHGVLIDGYAYTFTKVTYAPDNVDLAICKMDRVMPRWVAPYAGPVAINSHVIMLGYGCGGFTYPTSFQAVSSPPIKHWGTNSVDAADVFVADSYDLQLNYYAVNDGAQPTTEFEAGYGIGDSGGGTYMKDADGFWKLVGVNVRAGSTVSYPVSVPHYYQWIVSNTTLPGDTNFDNKVSFSDYITLEVNFGKLKTGGYSDADFNLDGMVNFADYLLLEQNFGKNNLPVPEPATLSLLVAGGLAVLRRRR